MDLISTAVAIASQTFPKLSRRVLASSGYTLDVAKFAPDDFAPWDDATAARQDRAWQPIVARAIAGQPREDVSALIRALETLDPTASLLEVGCGGGYVSEILSHAFPGLEYRGVDLAESMIALAHEHYPSRDFRVASSYDLPFDDSSIDYVMDGVAIIHMMQWRTALAQYARVARRGVVLHGLTLTELPTAVFAKYAYGQLSQELVFNRVEMLEACAALGLALEGVFPGLDYDLARYLRIPSVSETWVLTPRG